MINENKIKKLYIGIDPDLRLLNAALITGEKEVLAVFVRRNKEGSGETAVALAAANATLLLKDIMLFLGTIQDRLDPECSIVTIIESQSMQHAIKLRKKGKKVNLDDILTTGQIAGCMLGAFASVRANSLCLVQPITWKGSISCKGSDPKRVSHNRYYAHLGIKAHTKKLKGNIHPENIEELSKHSFDEINPGDFADINDSLGLADYGAERKL